MSARTDPDPAEQDLQRRLAEVETRLAAEPGSSSRQAAAAHAAQLERLRDRYETRFAAMDAVHGAIAGLREVTSPAAILGGAPVELCRCSKLERAVISLVRDGHLVAEAAWFEDDAVGAAKALEMLRTEALRLEHPLVETDVVRRRRATIVTDAQAHPRVHRPTARTMGWHAYVAAPLVVGGQVIGVIHADAGRSGAALDVLAGDILWTFTKGLAEVYETASLRRALRRESSELRKFVEWLGTRSSELSDAPMHFAAEQAEASDPPGGLDVRAAGARVDDRAVFEDLLTRREVDVLRLVVRGQPNSAIADGLVISQATVKFHVTNILRKLHVSNRAEAVSRYYRLVRGSAATRPTPPTPSERP